MKRSLLIYYNNKFKLPAAAEVKMKQVFKHQCGGAVLPIAAAGMWNGRRSIAMPFQRRHQIGESSGNVC